MRNRYKIFLLLLFFTVNVFSQKMEHKGAYFTGKSEKEFDVKGQTNLKMESIKGNVSITGEARNSIVICEIFSIKTYSESHANKIFDDEKARFVQSGNSVVIESRDNSSKYSSSYEIKVPLSINIEIDASGCDMNIGSVNGDMNIETSGGDIKITDTDGEIYIKTSGGDIVANKCEGEIGLYTSGGDICADYLSGDLDAKTSGGDIDVKGFSGVGTIKTSGGDLILADINGKNFNATTSGGNIHVENTSSKMNLHTSGGNIIVVKSSVDLQISTSGGYIRIDEIEGNLEATTSGGDIDIDYAAGKVYAKTSGGDVKVIKVGNKTGKEYSIEIITSGGNIDLSIPDNMNANIKAQIKQSRKYGDYTIKSDFSMKINKETKASHNYITGETKINGGGTPVLLQTNDGNIRIREQ